MISVDEARRRVRERVRPLQATERESLPAATGRVLAATVLADRDDPPFARSMMDGYALRSKEAPGRFAVTGRVAAGDATLPDVEAGCAVWINTGAPVPPGADAVVPVERTRPGEGEVFVPEAVPSGANVLGRGALVVAGEAVLLPGQELTPERVAVCAVQGTTTVELVRRPRVAVLATGTELNTAPGAHEIRNSNGPLLLALLRRYEVLDLGVAGDHAEALAGALRRGLAEADVLVTTGGVSKGDRDLVPPALHDLGVETVFHGVALQPGKPVLFGMREGRAVFALPGNPASALVCAHLFLMPYLCALSGASFDDALETRDGRLGADVAASAKRRRVFPCVLADGEVEPLPWRSSADLYTLTRANAYMIVEPGRGMARGELVRCLVPRR